MCDGRWRLVAPGDIAVPSNWSWLNANLYQALIGVLRTCKKTCTYVFPRDAAERDLACTGESVVVLLSV
ncbi:hypothetical protein LAZ67_16002587 [Cordylochernes scorpioides]|uniref:Uncharacterized protein n=1 Tax=Cordylochernes scorpioides TaxID=51811 RepID=A0ABY6LFR4_9ARAC|nr:hypothetical protein LAZ67_16002587 [Cordylochernes scorpioides]